MVYPKSGWLQMVVQATIAVFVVAVVAVGCASPPAKTGATADSLVQTLGEVSVSRDGADSVVWLGGLIDPIYSVSTPEDANLIVVDLVGVGKAEAEDLMGVVQDEARQIAAYDGVVDLVTLATFDEEGDTPLTRVEIVLSAAGRAEVVSTGSGLEVRIIPGDVVAETTDSADADEMASVPWGAEDDSIDPPMSEPSEMTIATEFAPPAAATQLTSVSTKTTDGGVLVGLHSDGAIGNVEAFTLENPARLVVDLPGLTIAKGTGNVRLDSGLVTGVRLGAHDGKVRVVLDGGASADGFQGRQIMPGTTGLWLAIGSGDALTTAMNDALSASEAAWMAIAPVTESDSFAASTPAVVSDEVEAVAFGTETIENETSGSIDTANEMADMVEYDVAEIYGLHYERTDGMDRTAILADEAVVYKTIAVDATTLMISLPGAVISDEASDRIFPKSGGPVSLIHAFQQPEVAVPEVRVVFTRAPNLEPVVSRRGSMLFVDFEDVGIAAAPPPAFPNAGMEDGGTFPAATGSSVVHSANGTMQPGMSVDDEMAAEALAFGADPATAAMAQHAAAEMMGQPTPMEIASDLPSFDGGLADAGLPAMAMDDPNAVWDAPVEMGGGPAAVEVPAAIEVLEEGGLIDGKEYRGRRVSLDFKDVEIADVLRLIAEVSDLNIIAGDEVDGNVTIRLVEVPWDQALDVILMTKGLGFVRVGNVLRIAPSEVLKAEEEVRLQERRNKEKLEDLEVKLLPVNYAAVKDVEGLVKRLLSARGTVNLDERTNTLIIKDISSVIDEASALITAIDTQTPQVMIEAKIVEANLDFSRELGSVWGLQTQQFTDPFDPDTPRSDLGSEDLTFIDNNSLVFANPITSVPNGLLTLGALILNQDFRIDAQIQAAESTGDGKVVSSPRIVTLDNKEAKIEQGVSIPFQTFEGGDAKLEFIDAVLSLVVTPHITADESIIMEIEVTRNAPDDTVATPTGSPAIAKNVAETETLVKDGQTLVLGGIYTITKSQRQSRIPYLHRIPVIGNIFKANEITDARKELLVFVTPRIVRLPEMGN